VNVGASAPVPYRVGAAVSAGARKMVLVGPSFNLGATALSPFFPSLTSPPLGPDFGAGAGRCDLLKWMRVFYVSNF